MMTLGVTMTNLVVVRIIPGIMPRAFAGVVGANKTSAEKAQEKMSMASSLLDTTRELVRACVRACVRVMVCVMVCAMVCVSVTFVILVCCVANDRAGGVPVFHLARMFALLVCVLRCAYHGRAQPFLVAHTHARTR